MSSEPKEWGDVRARAASLQKEVGTLNPKEVAKYLAARDKAIQLDHPSLEEEPLLEEEEEGETKQQTQHTGNAATDFDLTRTFAKYLDRHLLVNLLKFTQDKGIYEEDDMKQAQFDLLVGTRMLDFALDQIDNAKLSKEQLADIEERKTQVFNNLDQYEKKTEKVLALVAGSVSELRDHGKSADAKSAFIQKHELSVDDVNDLYEYSQLLYDCGLYEKARDAIDSYELIGQDETKLFRSAWGRLAAEILLENTQAANKSLFLVRDAISASASLSELEKLHQRIWLCNWSLFVFFNTADGPGQFIEFLKKDELLLGAVQLGAPHLLRYYAVALLMRRGHYNADVNDLRDMIRRESNYSDPILQFVLAVFDEFDFAAATKLLRVAETVFEHDFFLINFATEFLEQTRSITFNYICKIHKYINIDTLVGYLDLDRVVDQAAKHEENVQLPLSDDARTARKELFIVELIRNSRVEAKIDSDNNRLVMTSSQQSVCQQVIDKTKSLLYRSNALTQQVEKKYQSLPIISQQDE